MAILVRFEQTINHALGQHCVCTPSISVLKISTGSPNMVACFSFVVQVIPWTVKVKISGQFVVEFKDSNVGRHQQVFSVADLPEYFPELKKIGEDTIEYISKGVLSIEQADKLTVKVREESIGRA